MQLPLWTLWCGWYLGFQRFSHIPGLFLLDASSPVSISFSCDNQNAAKHCLVSLGSWGGVSYVFPGGGTPAGNGERVG